MGRAAALLMLFGLLLPLQVQAAGWTDEYDALFEKYAKRYFGPHFDWRWFKAQGIAESNLRPNARSGAGAIGLMQILPTTFAEIQRANPHFVDILTPRWNVAAGIYYDRYLYRHDRLQALPDGERLLVAFAGYNAGLGGVLRAMRRSPPPVDSWQRMAARAPQETRNYVARIQHLKAGQLNRRPPSQRGLAAKLGSRPER